MEIQMNKYALSPTVRLWVCGLFCIIWCNSLIGQVQYKRSRNISDYFKPKLSLTIQNFTLENLGMYPPALITKSFDADDLPFFCKIEHKIERIGKIPFRFRLGDLNYVNMLENKR